MKLIYALPVLAWTALATYASAAPIDPVTPEKSNIIYILADDLSENLLPYMPNVQLMQKEGVTFSNFFVTDSLCCPSRTTILTGKLPHNSGVFTNTSPDGGFFVFKDKGNAPDTFAVALSDANFETGMLGKYLNLYNPRLHAPEAGWTHWSVAGDGYRGFNYVLNKDNVLETHGSTDDDYMTDVLSNDADAFVRKNEDRPFLIEIATFAPHGPFTPAPRHENLFEDVVMPKGENFNKHPKNAPRWLASIPLQEPKGLEGIEKDFRKRVRSVQAIDEMIGRLRATLKELNLDRKTYVVFNSDNGFHLGEHGLRGGKQTAYDHDVRVPLIVVGPGIEPSSVNADIIQNTDLCPTFAQIAGTVCPRADGLSLLPLLQAPETKFSRNLALIEHRNRGFNPADPDAVKNRGNPPSYNALRSKDFLFVSYVTGFHEYYDLNRDPQQMQNIYRTLPAAMKKKLEDKTAFAAKCVGPEQCQTALSW